MTICVKISAMGKIYLNLHKYIVLRGHGGNAQFQFSFFFLYIIYNLYIHVTSIQHTYPEKKYMAIDLYCCNENVEFKNVLDEIHEFFNNDCIIRPKAFLR